MEAVQYRSSEEGSTWLPGAARSTDRRLIRVVPTPLGTNNVAPAGGRPWGIRSNLRFSLGLSCICALPESGWVGMSGLPAVLLGLRPSRKVLLSRPHLVIS